PSDSRPPESSPTTPGSSFSSRTPGATGSAWLFADSQVRSGLGWARVLRLRDQSTPELRHDDRMRVISMGFAEVFVATHDEALKRAGALERGADVAGDAVRIPGISDFEVEQLGDLAGTAVHAAGADYELAMVDVTSDSLLGVPAAMVRALAELLSYESEGEGDVLEDVAGKWAAQEDMPFGPEESQRYVRRLAELAVSAEGAERSGLYVWSN